MKAGGSGLLAHYLSIVVVDSQIQHIIFAALKKLR